jgi:hypothetical protein
MSRLDILLLSADRSSEMQRDVQEYQMSETVPTINRIAVVVEPKEPYRVWARDLDGNDPTIDGMSREHLTSVYLIEEDPDSEEPLRRHWDWIFAENLHSWCRDSSSWPQGRTYTLFKEWFDVRVVDMVFDLDDAPLRHDEF